MALDKLIVFLKYMFIYLNWLKIDELEHLNGDFYVLHFLLTKFSIENLEK